MQDDVARLFCRLRGHRRRVFSNGNTYVCERCRERVHEDGSIACTPRTALQSRILWHLRKPYSWSVPHGWGWEGPEAGGRTRTERGAWRAIRKATRALEG